VGAGRLVDHGERSAFVAGQRVRRVRHRRARRLARLRGVAGAVVAVVALAAGATLGAQWLLSAPQFAVRHVDVRGLTRVAPGRVRDAAGIEAGVNVFRLRPDEVAARVQALPEVRRAEVIRELPDRVAILVEERQPFALVYLSEGSDAPLSLPRLSERTDAPLSLPRLSEGGAGRLVWIADDGHVVGEERRAVAVKVPIISGLAERDLARPGSDASSRARAALAIIHTLLGSGSALGDEISDIDMTREDDPVLRTVSGIDVRLGAEALAGEDWSERVARLEAVLAQVAATDPDVSVVDVRFKDQVVLRRGGQPSDGRRPKI
jgi:cell division septal protein FtsQ